MRFRHPQVFVPDPTEKLVGKMREFVESNGSKFMVGIQNHDDALASYLEETGFRSRTLRALRFIRREVGARTGGQRVISSSPTAFCAC